MVKLFAPPGAGSISCAGATFDVVEGEVEVPFDVVADLLVHGCSATRPEPAVETLMVKVDTSALTEELERVRVEIDTAKAEGDQLAAELDRRARLADEDLAHLRDALEAETAAREKAENELKAAAVESARVTEALTGETKARQDAEELLKLASDELAALKAAPKKVGK